MKKRVLSLIEIMIVIFLITIVTGAIGYNMKGALDRGKKFRTVQAKEQLNDLLLICLNEKGPKKGGDIAKNPKKYLTESGIAKNPKKLVLDGWGNPFKIVYEKGQFTISSENYNEDQ